jgi:hypothetical protein
MTVMVWMARAMTLIVIGATINEAAYGDRFGLVIVGYLISVFGIITCALADRPPGADRERRS